MKFLWWLKYAVDLAIQSRGVIQADAKPPNHQVVKLARDSGRSPRTVSLFWEKLVCERRGEINVLGALGLQVIKCPARL